MANILEVEQLKVTYGKSIAVHDIQLAVPEGKVVTLVGANGAGKSTILKALMGMVPVSCGSIRFCGESISGEKISDRVKKGMVLAPEGRELFPYLSVYNNLILGATLRRDKDGIADDLEFVYQLFPKLKDRRNQKAGTLSGGEQQMVSIARGIMAKPKLLMLDEPSLGLAPIVIEHIGSAIREINKSKNMSILLIEQNVHLAFGAADYCYALSVGEMVAEGTIQDIQKNNAVKKAYFGG